MGKKFVQVSLAIFLVLALATMASAAANVASTSQKGSLLVFPKVVSFTSAGTVDTLFFIANDYPDDTYIKCYWMDNNQSVEDFHFVITANQPIVFSAKYNTYGPPFGLDRVGSLVCWAQDKFDAKPVQWNHLYGYAMIQGGGVNVFYNAFAFPMVNLAAAYTPLANGAQLNLDGLGYYACPKYNITEFVPYGGALGNGPDLTLWPCKQDLRQDRTPTCTKAKFDIWNWNEVKFTGAYQCFKCFYEGFLWEVGSPGWVQKRGPGFGGEKFWLSNLGIDTGLTLGPTWTPARLRVQAIASDAVCIGNIGTDATKSKTKVAQDAIYCTKTVNTGVLGVVLYGTPIPPGAPASNQAPGIIPVAGYTTFGAGIANGGDVGYVQYDPSFDQVIPESAGR